MAEPKVIYTDNHLLVLNKPMGMITQPDLEEWGKKWMKRPFAHAVHRLDRPASGIVVIAKTSKALSRLHAAMKQSLFQKTYHAIVEGMVKLSEGMLEDFLMHDDYRARVASEGKIARLRYRVLEKKEQKTLVEVKLLTGRYHQIRVQFASRGHPIVGDEKYGSCHIFSSGIALHHHRLSFPHPVSGHEVICEAPFPFAWVQNV